MRPKREHATNNQQTYMVTSSTWERRALFRNERWARLLIDTVYHYRGSAHLLHEFVVMPDHVHLLITRSTSLEKAVQFMKRGFSYRARKELGSNLEIWQKGFEDHRIRDAADYDAHVTYIRENPVAKHLCDRAENYPYSSACGGFELDPIPQGLKPLSLGAAVGAAEAAPCQSNPSAAIGAAEAAPRQSNPSAAIGAPEAAPCQSNPSAAIGAPEAAPCQSNPSAAIGAPEAAPCQTNKKPCASSTNERPMTKDQRLTFHAQTH